MNIRNLLPSVQYQTLDDIPTGERVEEGATGRWSVKLGIIGKGVNVVINTVLARTNLPFKLTETTIHIWTKD